MAEWRSRADERLALDLAQGHAFAGSRRQRQTALAHRTRLRGVEGRTRFSPLRRSRLAWISPPRDTLHRSLWLREAIPPSAPWQRKMPLLPKGFRPRGSADPARTSRRKLDRD